MKEQARSTTQIQLWLDRHRAGDERAKDEIIAMSCDRLRLLARKMLRGNYARLRRWEQAEDVLQMAVIRLHRSLGEVYPESLAEFLGLAATQIRRTLLDLARQHRQTWLSGTTFVNMPDTKSTNVEGWTTFHEAVEKLPNAE